MNRTDDRMTASTRDANMDLMRIVAMLLVMVYHSNYYNLALEEGTSSEYTSLQLCGYAMMKCISMVCVNLFILISGWYGIQPNAKKLSALTFQIWFFSGLTYIILCLCYADLTFSVNIFVHLLLFGGYWFIPAYLLLYICSPVLNTFVQHAAPQKMLYVIIFYFLFQFYYGWLERGIYFNHGCSPLVFFGLYLTARYIKLHAPQLTRIKTTHLALCYALLLIGTTLLCTFLTLRHQQEYAEMLMQNSSPFNTALSITLLLIFSRIRIRNRHINRIGISCFAVFLLHGSPFFYEKIYHPFGCYAFQVTPAWLSVLLILTFIFLIFTISILIDQIRIALWKWLTRRLRVTAAS